MLSEQCKKRLSRWFKLRFAILYPLTVWAIISSYSTDESIMRSVWFILLGLGIRAWANCYAIKMEKLTTSGPYAYLRHPLYLGSFLIMIGFLIMLNVSLIWILSTLAIVIGVIYKMTVENEEKMLLKKFGQEYVEYHRVVPAFLPKFIPFRGGQKWGPGIKRYFKSQEYKLFIWVIILMIAFHLKEEFIIEGESFDAKIIFLMAVSLLLGLTDVIGEILRKKQAKSAC